MSEKAHQLQAKVPFSWEKKPGVSKDATKTDTHITYNTKAESNQIKQVSMHHSRSKTVVMTQKDSQCVENIDLKYNQIKYVSKPLPLPPSRSKIIMLAQKDSHRMTDTDAMYNQIKYVSIGRVHDTQFLPLPPCGFSSPNISTRKKGRKKQEDPFLNAYKECTKSGKDDDGGHGIRKNLSIFSCKHSCSVRDDSKVMLIPKNSILSKSQGEKRGS